MPGLSWLRRFRLRLRRLLKRRRVRFNVLVERGMAFKRCGFAGEVRIGYRSYANDSFFRNCEIGRFCSIGRRCSIGAARHPISTLSTHPAAFPDGFEVGPPTVIGNDVWIGDNAVVMAGLRLADGAVVGAGAVVTRDVGPYEIVGGTPARLIRNRFDADTVARLMASQWWLYGDLALEAVKPEMSPASLSDWRPDPQDRMPTHHQPMIGEN